MVESVILPGNEPAIGKMLDLAMMVLPGGMERTEAQYRELSRRRFAIGAYRADRGRRQRDRGAARLAPDLTPARVPEFALRPRRVSCRQCLAG